MIDRGNGSESDESAHEDAHEESLSGEQAICFIDVTEEARDE